MSIILLIVVIIVLIIAYRMYAKSRDNMSNNDAAQPPAADKIAEAKATNPIVATSSVTGPTLSGASMSPAAPVIGETASSDPDAPVPQTPLITPGWTIYATISSISALLSGSPTLPTLYEEPNFKGNAWTVPSVGTHAVPLRQVASAKIPSTWKITLRSGLSTVMWTRSKNENQFPSTTQGDSMQISAEQLKPAEQTNSSGGFFSGILSAITGSTPSVFYEEPNFKGNSWTAPNSGEYTIPLAKVGSAKIAPNYVANLSLSPTTASVFLNAAEPRIDASAQSFKYVKITDIAEAKTKLPVIYMMKDYFGPSQIIPTAGKHKIDAVLDNFASSVRIPAGWSMDMFDSADCTGKFHTINADTRQLPKEYENAVSCVIVRGPA